MYVYVYVCVYVCACVDGTRAKFIVFDGGHFTPDATRNSKQNIGSQHANTALFSVTKSLLLLVMPVLLYYSRGKVGSDERGYKKAKK